MQKNRLIILLTLILLPIFLFSQKSSPKLYFAKWVLVRGCSMKVAGSTNVNNFTCEITDYSSPDTIYVYNPSGEQFLPLKGALHLDISKFNCHNPMMTSDLFKTLKGKQYPQLVVQFISLNRFPELVSSKVPLSGVVNIELAGASKNYIVNYSYMKEAANIIHLIGTRQVTFSDFNLTPPRKLGGMIKTREELQVEFHLILKVIN